MPRVCVLVAFAGPPTDELAGALPGLGLPPSRTADPRPHVERLGGVQAMASAGAEAG